MKQNIGSVLIFALAPGNSVNLFDHVAVNSHFARGPGTSKTEGASPSNVTCMRRFKEV